MKNLQLNAKKITGIGVVFLALTIGSFTTNRVMQSKISNQSSLSSGTNTCFTRVSQTFTALMIQDFSSSYLTQNFTDTTAECFTEAKTQFTSLFGTTFKDGFKSINALSSDLHWFHEKVQKLINLSRDNQVELSNSNILGKYSSLEELKNNFQDSLDKKTSELNRYSQISLSVNIISLAGFLLSIGLLFVQKRSDREALNKIEKEASALLDSESEIISAQFERLMESALKRSGLDNTYSLFNQYHAELLEKHFQHFESSKGISNDNISDQKVNRLNVNETIEMEVKEALIKANFQEAMTTVLEAVTEKAFTHGIILDTDLEDHFWVKGDQETLEQLIYTVMTYATESAQCQVEGRKISLKSKPLGGTALFQVKLNNYCFNANELNYLNGQSESSDSVGMNLVLIHEMVKDLGANIAVKNKMNAQKNIEGSEFEIIFDRVKEDLAPVEKKVSIVKGTKKEILKSMSL